MTLRVEMLNHASALVRVGPLALLSDPWFEGVCFSGGWGLRYHNPEAYDAAASATHLWVSHWHSDHLHAPTLAKLAERNPSICVLANLSANFSMVERMRGLGFTNVIPLGEREPLELDGFVLTRYPTAGIDNMLHVEGHGWSVLNYNDCNLPALGIRGLRRTLGPIDLLLTNYNHAGKLFTSNTPDQDARLWFGKLVSAVDALAPRRVVPFASSHYYRVAASAEQNASLLSFDDLERLTRADARFCVLRIGDTATFPAPGARPTVTRRDPPLEVEPEERHDYGESIDERELLAACSERSAAIRGRFGPLARMVTPLRVWLEDLSLVIELSLSAPARRLDGATADRAHISAHSRAIVDWMGRRFGDDTFFAGAHFGICDRDTRVIERWALVTLLDASDLTPFDLLRYLRSATGLSFLWSRREEMVASVARGRIKAGQSRL